MALQIEVLETSFANTYLLSDGNDSIIVDPSCDKKTLERFAKGKKIKFILLTHGHYDHFAGLEELCKNLDIPVYMHQNAYKKVLDNSQNYSLAFGKINNIKAIENLCFVQESSIIQFNNYIIKVLETFGHTNCSVSYVIENNIFSGDFLFADSVGRTDLITGSNNALKNSIKRIMKFSDYHFYPGHDQDFILKDIIDTNLYLV